MSISSTAEQRALHEAVLAATAKTDPIGAVRRADPAAGREQWAALADVGLFGVALPERCAGAGGTVSDLAAGLAAAASALVPGPVLPTALAGLVLARGSGGATDRLPAIAQGDLPVGVGLGPPTLRWRRAPDGVVVTGTAHTVLGAEDGRTALLLGAEDADRGECWFLLEPGHPGVRISARPPLDPSRSLARVELTEVLVPAELVLPGLTVGAVTDLAVTLAAAELAGVAEWCLRTAAEYAKTREQFGRPIGSFQAVKHLCVDMLCRTEQLTALAWDAARVAEEAPGELPIAAAAAGALALDAAVGTAKDTIQVLGGIGFTWEHDTHLYLRRALALRQLLGPGEAWRSRTAELALSGARRTLRVSLDAAVEARRPALRAEVAEIAALPPPMHRARLAETGLFTPHWPVPYGRDADPSTQLLIDEELDRAGLTRPDLVIGAWALPTLLRHGTAAQVERFVLPTLRGELTWCQLFSEPGAGSDLAGLRTRADPAPGGWRLTGQKVWTSLAGVADWAICLARTDPAAAKHRGISYFLVDMRSPGITVRPLREITGDELFNEVFLDEVFVPADCLVGPEHGGWPLARTTLANERVAMSAGSAFGAGVERLLARYADSGVDQPGRPGLEQRLGALIAQGLSVSLLRLRGLLRQLDGQDPGSESSVHKLVGVAHRQDVAELALELLGPDGAATDGPATSAAHEFLLSRCLSIAGGTTQVLSTLAGERLLGLPREPRQ
jgi:hypothetical protein